MILINIYFINISEILNFTTLISNKLEIQILVFNVQKVSCTNYGIIKTDKQTLFKYYTIINK